MRLSSQKRIAAQLLKCGKSRIVFDPNKLSEIKEAITKLDIKSLIKSKAIQKRQKSGLSKGRTRDRKIQYQKGRRKGKGSRKGSQTARLPRKMKWVKQIRVQRGFLVQLKLKKLITSDIYRQLKQKIKGGFFRSKRHIKGYIDEHNLISKNETNTIQKKKRK